MPFDLRDLGRPILGAPMAGGPTTPELAAAVSNAGGLGFLAGGYLTMQRLADDIVAARALTTGAIGVNLFVPQRSVAVPAALDRYRTELEPLAARYGVETGAPRWDDDDWVAKLDVVAGLRPEVVSFTFAMPVPDVPARMRALGILTLMTVTTVAEATVAAERGVDGLVVQGPRAGGHRGTWGATLSPPDQPLDELLGDIGRATDLPLVAAGGLATAVDVAAVLRSGASAAQLGTALLLSDEAGTNPVHRSALTSGEFVETVVTCAFSGRFARGLRNAFVGRYDGVAPFGYPEVHHMTSPIRRAAVAAGDPDATNLWAGTSFATTRAGPAAAILAELTN